MHEEITTLRQLEAEARRVDALLRARKRRIVFAESCTAGLVAATLARQPGISEFLCGSAVVYQSDTKAAWLDVPRPLLADPGPVSREVAEAMSLGVLHQTPHADMAAAVTGHLGPNAPPRQDGLIFISVSVRHPKIPDAVTTKVRKLRLSRLHESTLKVSLRQRVGRQRTAAWHVLEQVRRTLLTVPASE